MGMHGIIWHCGLSSTPTFLFCAPLTERRVSPGICLVPVLAHLCYSVHTISSEGCKEDFYYAPSAICKQSFGINLKPCRVQGSFKET